MIFILFMNNKINYKTSICLHINTKDVLDDIRHHYKLRTYEETVIKIIELHYKKYKKIK